MLQFIFAVFTIVLIILNIIKIHDRKRIIKAKNDNEEIEDFNKIFGIVFIIWHSGGLLSSQWILILIHIIYMLTIGVIFKKYLVKDTRYIISGIVTIITALAVLINSWHLHIDLLELLKSWI